MREFEHAAYSIKFVFGMTELLQELETAVDTCHYPISSPDDMSPH